MIRAVAARGVTIVMIEHVMQAVMSLAEHVFVLAEGPRDRRRLPAELPPTRAWWRPISGMERREDDGGGR